MLPALLDLAHHITSIPSAPYQEHLIRTVIEDLLRPLPGVSLRRDSYGNLLATYSRGSAGGREFMMVAHMDHPGFAGPATGESCTVKFLGGVSSPWFPGSKVRFFNSTTGRTVLRTQVLATTVEGEDRSVTLKDAVPAGSFGMWDLPSGRASSTAWIGRACDDLIGVITMVAVLRQLSETRANARVTALFSRAEEVGFHGSLAAIRAVPPLPRVPVLSLETSNARGFAKYGAGPVIRVGDRSSVFDSKITGWLTHAAGELNKKRPFPVQRLLMAGGTCEATVFQHAGFATGALCLPLRNYHNMGPRNRIAAEAVSLTDWSGLIELLLFAATKAPPPAEVHRIFSSKLAQREKTALRELRKAPKVRKFVSPAHRAG